MRGHICESMVVFQNHTDLLNGDSDESRVTPTLDGNEVTSIEAERVSHITQGEDQEPTAVPAIRTEHNVSCMPVVSVGHISYRLYPDLPSPMSLCPCETKI